MKGTATSLASHEPNIYHFVMDIAWFGLALATTSRFLSVYAIHLGATAAQLSWMTALPALVMLLASTFSGWWRNHYVDTRHAIFWPALGYRFSFFLLALTPFVPAGWQMMWLFMSLALPAIPQGVGGVMFLVLMRESVDLERWVMLNSRRHMAMNAALAIGALLAGFWLENVVFPRNYQIMFLAAFAATIISLWHVVHVEPHYTTPPVRVSLLDRSLWRSPQLRDMVYTVIVTHIAFFSVYPLVPLRLVEGLNAHESFIAIFGLMELAGGVLVAGFASRWARRWGYRVMIAYAMAATGVAVGVIALAPVLWLTLPAACLLGGSWTLVGISIMGIIANATPPEQAIPYNMVFLQTIGLATFIGPLIGNAVMNAGVDLVPVLLFGAALRLLAGLAFRSLGKRSSPVFP